jgi:septal ring-binding cell division protein DamX
MAALSWKSLSLLGAILLIALGLQAGAIKIMVNLHQPDEPVLADAPQKPAPSTRAESPPPVKPTEIIADPPHLASPTATPEPAHGSPNAEAHSPEVPLPSPEAHGSKPSPSPEAQLSPKAHDSKLPPSSEAQTLPAAAHNPMASNIPPPIELDPEPAAEEPAPATPHAASAEANLATATPLAEPAASTTLLEPNWLKGRDSKRYTVQLYSGKDMAQLRQIAGSVTGAAPSAYFVTTSRSGPWYSLVVGDYPDFTAAQTVATQIAAQSSTLKPWIRRFSEIQAKMR